MVGMRLLTIVCSLLAMLMIVAQRARQAIINRKFNAVKRVTEVASVLPVGISGTDIDPLLDARTSAVDSPQSQGGTRWSDSDVVPLHPLIVVVLPFYVLCVQRSLESFLQYLDFTAGQNGAGVFFDRTSTFILLVAYMIWIARHFRSNMRIYFPEHFGHHNQHELEKLRTIGFERIVGFAHLFTTLTLFYFLAAQIAPPNEQQLFVIVFLVIMDFLLLLGEVPALRPYFKMILIPEANVRAWFAYNTFEIFVCVLVWSIWTRWSSEELWNWLFGWLPGVHPWISPLTWLNFPESEMVDMLWSLAALAGVSIMAMIRIRRGRDTGSPVRG